MDWKEEFGFYLKCNVKPLSLSLTDHSDFYKKKGKGSSDQGGKSLNKVTN